MKITKPSTPDSRLRGSPKADASEIASTPKRTETSLETVKEVREMVDAMEDDKYKTVHEMGPKLSALAATERFRQEGVSSGTSAFSLFVKERLWCDRRPEDDDPLREVNPISRLMIRATDRLMPLEEPAPPTSGQLASEFLKSDKSDVPSADPARLLQKLEEATDKSDWSATDILITGAPILESGSWDDIVGLASLACTVAQADDGPALGAAIGKIDEQAKELEKGIYADMTKGYTIPGERSHGYPGNMRFGRVATYVPPQVKEEMTPFLAKAAAKAMKEKGMDTDSILRQTDILLSSDPRLAGLEYRNSPKARRWLDEDKLIEGNAMGFAALREHHSARVEMVTMLAAGAEHKEDLLALEAYSSSLPSEIKVEGANFDRRDKGYHFANVADETRAACDAVASRQAGAEQSPSADETRSEV